MGGGTYDDLGHVILWYLPSLKQLLHSPSVCAGIDVEALSAKCEFEQLIKINKLEIVDIRFVLHKFSRILLVLEIW